MTAFAMLSATNTVDICHDTVFCVRLTFERTAEFGFGFWTDCTRFAQAPARRALGDRRARGGA